MSSLWDRARGFFWGKPPSGEDDGVPTIYVSPDTLDELIEAATEDALVVHSTSKDGGTFPSTFRIKITDDVEGVEGRNL